MTLARLGTDDIATVREALRIRSAGKVTSLERLAQASTALDHLEARLATAEAERDELRPQADAWPQLAADRDAARADAERLAEALQRIYWLGVAGEAEEIIIGVLTPEQRVEWAKSKHEEQS